ncbi:response regulator [Geomesophilobacter sediminis]|nr:response regulator [Geomesophilobacter sediminis]
MKSLRVLLVEDSLEDSLLLLRELSRGGYKPDHQRVQTADDLRRALVEEDWDVILSDYRMPGFDASAALAILQESGKDIPFIIVSGKIGEDLAVAALKGGASDYVMKGSLARLVPVVERELREAAERRQYQSSQSQVRRAKAEWEAAFDAVSDLILVTDPEGHIVRCNARVTAYFDCNYVEVLGKPIERVFFGDALPEEQPFRFVTGVYCEPTAVP